MQTRHCACREPTWDHRLVQAWQEGHTCRMVKPGSLSRRPASTWYTPQVRVSTSSAVLESVALVCVCCCCLAELAAGSTACVFTRSKTGCGPCAASCTMRWLTLCTFFFLPRSTPSGNSECTRRIAAALDSINLIVGEEMLDAAAVTSQLLCI